MKYYIDIKEDSKEILLNEFSQLAKVEVRGDSVEYLFASRIILKNIIESLKEVKEEKEIKKEKG